MLISISIYPSPLIYFTTTYLNLSLAISLKPFQNSWFFFLNLPLLTKYQSNESNSILPTTRSTKPVFTRVFTMILLSTRLPMISFLCQHDLHTLLPWLHFLQTTIWTLCDTSLDPENRTMTYHNITYSLHHHRINFISW